MNKNIWRIVAPVVLCASLSSGAFAEDVAVDEVTELYRVDQSKRLAALTDEQLQAILGRVENHRGDALQAANQRRGKDQDRDTYGAKKN